MTKEKTNIKLTFIVYGEMFDIEQLTRIIEVTPTEQAYKGDQLKYRISEETFWEYKFTTQLRFCVNHYEINAALTFETTILDILHQLNGEIDIDQYFYK